MNFQKKRVSQAENTSGRSNDTPKDYFSPFFRISNAIDKVMKIRRIAKSGVNIKVRESIATFWKRFQLARPVFSESSGSKKVRNNRVCNSIASLHIGSIHL